MRRRLLRAGLLLAALPLAARAQPTAFPSRPIRFIVPFAAGSGTDSGGRVYAEFLSKMVGVPVVVENRPGASGQLAIQTLRQAPADGYTVLLATNSPLTVNPIVVKNLAYDPVKDLRPLTGMGRGPAAFVVKGDSPARSMQDLVALARRDKRSLAAGNYSAGYQLINAWLGHQAGIEMNHIAYKGGSQMVNDVISGDLDFGSIDFGGVSPLLGDGRIRVLAITADKRQPAFADIPTMKESGFPEFESWVWSAFYVRAETPDDVTNRLSDLIRQMMVSDKARAYQATQPSEPMINSPDEMRRFQLAEFDRFRRIADQAGIKAQ